MRAILPGLSVLIMGGAGAVQAEPVTRERIEQELRSGLLEVWFPRVLDREQGGFLCDFDSAWKPAGGQPKTVVFQSRMVWLASQAAMRYPDDPRYLEAARHGFAFLREKMWDAEQGGFYWHLDRSGRVTPEWQGLKHAYGVSFGIYAAAAYHKATKDPRALALARDAFAWLDRHAHDERHLGYHEFLLRDGAPILTDAANPLGRDRDCIGTRVGYKSMNTHIHLLEAFAALYEVSPEPRVKERTAEVLSLVRDRITAPPGAMHQFFNRDWTPVPDVDSVGHDVETAYLLLEAAAALGLRDDPKTAAVAKSLLDHGLDYGWDREKGGFFESCGTFGPVHDKTKVWWSQAEGLNALLLMAIRHPEDPRGYRKLFEQQWRYIDEYLIDHEHGEWYPAGLDAGGDAKAAKSSQWKAGYHTGRALLNAVEWLGEDG